MKPFFRIAVCSIFIAGLGACGGADTTTDPNLIFPPKNNGSQRTPLDDYVYSAESMQQFEWFHAEEFDYSAINEITNESYTAHIINMTTGAWLTEEEVGERHVWWHILMIIMPHNLRPEMQYQSNAYIWITHNTNTRNENTGMPDTDDEYIIQTAALATGIGMPAALLFQVSLVINK